MQINISSLRDRNSMERISSQCRALKRDQKLRVWFHLVIIHHSLIKLWDLIANRSQLQTNSKTSTEFSNQAEIEDQEKTRGRHKISSTGMMGTEETTTGLMSTMRRKERAMARRKNTTVMNIADRMTRLTRECKAVHSEEQTRDRHRISRIR